jgi:hypothetical protein
LQSAARIEKRSRLSTPTVVSKRWPPTLSKIRSVSGRNLSFAFDSRLRVARRRAGGGGRTRGGGGARGGAKEKGAGRVSLGQGVRAVPSGAGRPARRTRTGRKEWRTGREREDSARL